MKLKHDERLQLGKVKILSFLSLVLGLSQGLFLYVMSTYFKDAARTDNIGIFYLLSFAVVLFALLNLHKIIKKIGKSDFFYASIFFKVITIIVLLFTSPGPLGIMAVIIYNIFIDFQWVGMDMLLEAYSSDRASGRIRGVFLVAQNIGLLLSPLISAAVLDEYGYYGIFFLLLVSNVFVLLFGAFTIGKTNHVFHGRLGAWDVVKKAMRRSDIRRIFYISFVLDFFFALMIIYTPLYLLDYGFTWKDLGVIFTVMLLPFVFVQYPAGLLADKKLGEKEMLILSIVLMGFSTLAIYFITSKSLWVWAAVLFVTRIGAALIQILRDSYFYKRIDGHDVDLNNFFRTSYPLGYIFGAFLSAGLLLFFPLKVMFILIAVVVLSALLPAFFLEDNL